MGALVGVMESRFLDGLAHPIWKMCSGTEVVFVEGYLGSIALTHIEPITEDNDR